jgi:vacuolar-type H+-ATPase subunit I/STV1
MGYKFDHPKFEELIIFSKKDSKIITNQYTNIAGKYIGHVKEISDKLKEADNQIKLLKKENELNQEKANNELMKKENELNQEKAKNELLKKDLEIMALLHNQETYRNTTCLKRKNVLQKKLLMMTNKLL